MTTLAQLGTKAAASCLPLSSVSSACSGNGGVLTHVNVESRHEPNRRSNKFAPPTGAGNASG